MLLHGSICLRVWPHACCHTALLVCVLYYGLVIVMALLIVTRCVDPMVSSDIVGLSILFELRNISIYLTAQRMAKLHILLRTQWECTCMLTIYTKHVVIDWARHALFVRCMSSEAPLTKWKKIYCFLSHTHSLCDA